MLKPRAPTRRQALYLRWTRLLLVLVVTFPLAWYGPADLEFLRGAVAVTGTVVGVMPPQPDAKPVEVRVSFDLGPERLRYPAPLGWFDHYQVGDPVAVIFNPEVRPYLKLDTPWQRYRFLGIWIAMISVISLLSGLRALLQRRLRRAKPEAKEEAKP